ncbi:hypothetical protein N7452_002715 [Penicillium brevicompactum]|uniref:Borealin N-terminal domain-containing protein n=1 Tax=Penicillium brevicompactum TaxID=5074 RepID=A0A9W9UJG7_PENBR|nr:hypothetical protein N7452_002715 [Penicillium brevicompactum]
MSTKRKSDQMDATPTGSPTKKMRLTQQQKQALMDNLQLEITERARKLRAQYALQANDLRARIDRRVNRIPVSLRKANMGELLEKHNAALNKQTTASPSRKYSPVKVSRNMSKPVDMEARDGRSRRGSHDGLYSDKENAPASGEPEGLKNPKRRVKPAAAGGASRVVSQEVRGNENRILSPKSSNSRTYPHSPFRASPEKGHSSYLARPTSPLKPSSPLRSRGATVSAVKDQRPPSQTQRTTNRAATGPKTTSRSPLPRPATRQGERKNSTGSTASSGTTVMKPTRTGAGARKATTASTAAAAKKPAPRMQAASVAVKKTANTAAMRKTTAPAATETATRTRALRKRI